MIITEPMMAIYYLFSVHNSNSDYFILLLLLASEE